MTTNRTILVFGATGQQGGTVVNHLLTDGWHVRAFIRNTSSGEKTQALVKRGVELVFGNMGDFASLQTAMQGVYGVFSVQPPAWPPNESTYAEELRLGKYVADAAKNAGVKHFVYSSVGGADKQAVLAHVNTQKWGIEQHIKKIGIPATIIRPPFFMENFVGPYAGIQNGILTDATKPDIPKKMIAVDDIGAFVLLAFQHPEKFLGKTIELAGDELTPPTIAAAISRITGHNITYTPIPIESVRQQNEILARMYQWSNEAGYDIDIPALRELHPKLMDFETWLHKVGRMRFDALFHDSDITKAQE